MTSGDQTVLFNGAFAPRYLPLAPDDESVIALERRPEPRLYMVQNWFAELERLVPVK
jgi:hypothetical protein